MRPRVLIETCWSSHERLLANLAAVPDALLREPSLLPGYSRSHVVAHLANKAEAHIRVFEGAVIGEIRQLHPDGYDPDATAEVRAHRPAEELHAVLSRGLARLEAAWDNLADAHWSGQAIMMAGRRSMAEVVAHHLRNIEVHHVDLDIGYRPADWPEVFVETELSKRLRTLPDRAEHADLLIWLLDRAPAPSLAPW